MFKKIMRALFKKKWNSVIDKIALPIMYSDINWLNKSKVNVSSEEVDGWLVKGGLTEFSGETIHKKGLEFFFSSYLLDINNKNVVLDAAGGRSNYLKSVKKNHGASELYLTDHIYKGVKELDDGFKLVGGDISAIHLEDECIDKIACHHAFEHFQENKDVGFINEAYRILRNKGVLVIIPLFLTNKYIECWNIECDLLFDNKATTIFDETASIPGADDDGHFARLYSYGSLIERILHPAEKLGFECEIIECELDGESIPDMSKNFGSLINKPTRALRFTKVK